MENQKMQEENAKNLEWGAHNPKLTDENFIDRNHKKLDHTDTLLAESNAPVDPKEEPGRNRKGATEGENVLDMVEKRGKVF